MTEGGGYRIRIDGNTLDARLFEAKVTQAEAAASAGDRAGAVALLHGALGLWRGPALAGLSGRIIEAAAGAWNDRRCAAQEAYHGHRLELGEHLKVIADLRAVVSAHPFRERPVAQLMLALYRCGRQAEALALYNDTRGLLAQELGLDPNRELQRLHQQILACDQELELPAADRIQVTGPATAVPPGPAVPQQLPAISPSPAGSVRESAGAVGRPRDLKGVPGEPRLDDAWQRVPAEGWTLGALAARDEDRCYEGRRAELARMLRLMAAPGRLPQVIRLHGPAGIGKTAFCYALARRCQARGWPAMIVDSRDFRHDAAALSEAIAIGCAGKRSPAGGFPLLLVLDTFEEMADIERDLWEVILPGITGPVLVVLSGRHPAAVRATSGSWAGLVSDMELAGLPDAEARRLVRRQRVRDPAAVTKIVEFAAGNPLLLIVAAQHSQRTGLSDAGLTRAVARTVLGEMTREVADPAGRDLLEAASLVRTFNQELLAAMLGHDVSAGFPALCNLSFVRVAAHGARVHDLVREAIAADLRWRAPQNWQAMRRRAYQYLRG